MKPILQPIGSTTCGQHVVAIVTSTPLNKVFDIFGHQHSTSAVELKRALFELGFDSGPFWRYKDILPKCCIARIHWTKSKTTHWIVINSGIVFCPVIGMYLIRDLPSEDLRITSYMEVFKSNR